MSFLHRLRRRFGRSSDEARLLQIHQGARILMKHVGLSGRCDCVRLRDAEGGTGFLLQIQTPMRVPAESREEFQAYFGRKIAQFGDIGYEPLILVIRDADDIRYAARAPATVSSARIASIVAAANSGDDQQAASDQLAQMRDVFRERREARRDSDYAPLQPAMLTDLGGLPSS